MSASTSEEKPRNSKDRTFLQSDAGDGTTAQQQFLHGYELVLTLVSLVATLFLAALDQTIVSTILSDISNRFGSLNKVGWLTSGFLLPMACLAPSYGKISVVFGRKRTLMAGIVIFELGSLIAALAQSMGMLIGGRVIQGIGGGAIQAMVIVIISESIPIDKRALAMALIGVTYSVLSVCGPFIGGAFSTHVTWRWCFYINLPVGGLALALLTFSFHPPKAHGSIRQNFKKIDLVGTFFLSSGLVLVLLAITFGGNEFPWRSAGVIANFCIGGVLLIIFAIWNFGYSKYPLIEREIIGVPQIVFATLTAFFSFCFFMGVLLVLALYFQVVWGASAWHSGIDLLPFIVSVSLSSVFTAVFIRYSYSIKVACMMCGTMGPIGTGLLLLLDVDLSTAKKIGLLIPVGIAVGLQFQSTLISAQVMAPGHIVGSMISVLIFINFSKNLGGVVGVVFTQLILDTRATVYIGEALTQAHITTPVQQVLLRPDVIYKLPEAARDVVVKAYMRAIRDTLWLNFAFACASFACAIFTTNKRVPKKKQIKYSDDQRGEEDADTTPESKHQNNPNGTRTSIV